MPYILENIAESERLERQSRLPSYQLSRELGDFRFLKNARVLDAGCGTGLVARYLAELDSTARIEGCDFSELRIRDARNKSLNPKHLKIRFFLSPLEKIDVPDGHYDHIVCRYVVEHLKDPLAVLREFRRILAPGGTVTVIDIDGLLFNLFPMSPKLATLSERLQNRLPVDPFIGRKIPSLLIAAGFGDPSWKVEALSFQGSELETEREMTRERFSFAMEQFSKVLGSDAAAEFVALYLEEMQRPGSTLFYNKFVVTASAQD